MKYKGNSKMIPVVKITNGQFKQLENYIHQMKIPINFIIFGTRKEYFYYFNNEAGPKIKEKKSNYKFGNAVGIEYSGKIFSLDLDNIKQE